MCVGVTDKLPKIHHDDTQRLILMMLEKLLQNPRYDKWVIQSFLAGSHQDPNTTAELLSSLLPTPNEVLMFLVVKSRWLVKYGCNPLHLENAVRSIVGEGGSTADEFEEILDQVEDKHYRLLDVFLPENQPKNLKKLFNSCSKEKMKAFLAAKLSAIEFINFTRLKSKNLELLRIYAKYCKESVLSMLMKKVEQMKGLEESKRWKVLETIQCIRPIYIHIKHTSHAVQEREELGSSASIPSQSDECQLKVSLIPSCKFLEEERSLYMTMTLNDAPSIASVCTNVLSKYACMLYIGKCIYFSNIFTPGGS